MRLVTFINEEGKPVAVNPDQIITVETDDEKPDITAIVLTYGAIYVRADFNDTVNRIRYT